jgi:hypothetical protein
MPLAERHAETLEIFRCMCIHDVVRLIIIFRSSRAVEKGLSVKRLLTLCDRVWNACARRVSLCRARAS